MIAPPAFSELCAELLRSGRAVRFVASGGSMSPAIRAGDVLRVAPVAATELRRGDVALYESPRGLTAHRVVRPARAPGGALRCRGDASGSEEAIAPEQILGRVVSVVRRSRGLAFDPSAGPSWFGSWSRRAHARIRGMGGRLRAWWARNRQAAPVVTNLDASSIRLVRDEGRLSDPSP